MQTVTIEELNKGGRPPISQEQKQTMLLKLEPYLKIGLSVRKACLQSGVPRANFYKCIEEDEEFRYQIERFQQFISVLVNSAIVRELQVIVEKQNGNEVKGIKPQFLNKDDIKFLWTFVLNSNLTKEEWGRRENVSLFDPEAEIQKVKAILEEATTKEISHFSSI